jgi:glc operon protein GlcG
MNDLEAGYLEMARDIAREAEAMEWSEATVGDAFEETRQGVAMQQMLSLGQAEAQRAIQVIQAELERRGKAAVIAVADAHGELIALLRLDGAPLASILIATNKAWTAARERKPTYEIGQKSRHPETGFDLANYGDRRYVGWGGGLPVRVDGTVVGAVAVSGLTQAEDIELAQMAVDALAGAASA